MRERVSRPEGRRIRARRGQVVWPRAAARGAQQDARAARGAGADRQPLGAHAGARRRHRHRRIHRRSSSGRRPTRPRTQHSGHAGVYRPASCQTPQGVMRMNIIERLDEARRRNQRPRAPVLPPLGCRRADAEELATARRQYREAVVALADVSDARGRGGRPSPTARACAATREEEAEHVELWDRFARRDRGAARARAGRRELRPQTAACAEAWTAGEEPARAPRDPLRDRGRASRRSRGQSSRADVPSYGYTEDGPAGEYFWLHAARDVEHARQARELIERLTGRREPRRRAGRADGRRAARRCAATGHCSTA